MLRTASVCTVTLMQKSKNEVKTPLTFSTVAWFSFTSASIRLYPPLYKKYSFCSFADPSPKLWIFRRSSRDHPGIIQGSPSEIHWIDVGLWGGCSPGPPSGADHANERERSWLKTLISVIEVMEVISVVAVIVVKCGEMWWTCMLLIRLATECQPELVSQSVHLIPGQRRALLVQGVSQLSTCLPRRPRCLQIGGGFEGLMIEPRSACILHHLTSWDISLDIKMEQGSPKWSSFPIQIAVPRVPCSFWWPT